MKKGTHQLSFRTISLLDLSKDVARQLGLRVPNAPVQKEARLVDVSRTEEVRLRRVVGNRLIVG